MERAGHELKEGLTLHDDADELAAQDLDFMIVETRNGVLNAEGTSYSVGDEVHSPGAARFEFQHTRSDVPEEGWAVQWVGHDGRLATIVMLESTEDLISELRSFTAWVADTAARESFSPDRVQLEVEVFVSLWVEHSAALNLGSDDQRVGDALVAMASEVSKVEHPPLEVLRPAFRWLARKLDVFVDEAVKTGGKAAGVAGVAGVAMVASGQAPRLAHLAARIAEILG